MSHQHRFLAYKVEIQPLEWDDHRKELLPKRHAAFPPGESHKTPTLQSLTAPLFLGIFHADLCQVPQPGQLTAASPRLALRKAFQTGEQDHK